MYTSTRLLRQNVLYTFYILKSSHCQGLGQPGFKSCVHTKKIYYSFWLRSCSGCMSSLFLRLRGPDKSKVALTVKTFTFKMYINFTFISMVLEIEHVRKYPNLLTVGNCDGPYCSFLVCFWRVSWELQIRSLDAVVACACTYTPRNNNSKKSTLLYRENICL